MMLKKKAALMLSGMLLLASLSGCSSKTEETELTENQRYAYAVVTAIEGNEITYMEVDESQVLSTEEDGEKETESKDSQKADTGSDSTSDGTPSGGASSEEAPSGEAPSDKPSGGAPSGEAPSGEAPSDKPSGGAPSGETPSDISSGGEAVDSDSTEMPTDSGKKDTSNLTGSVIRTQIPVGVVVHTAAGTETTFSRIATGDILKLLIETDDDGNEVILEIWMIEQ